MVRCGGGVLVSEVRAFQGGCFVDLCFQGEWAQIPLATGLVGETPC